MKKKIFTLLTLLLCAVTSSWADDAILSMNMGADGAQASSANSITGATGCAAEGFTIAITGNQTKNWSAGNGNISYNTVSYKTLKNSNGAQNTITCPSGKVATHVDFYAVTNDGSTKGKLSEIDGTSCSDVVNSLQDYSSPTVISKDIANKASFTFTFSTKQVCFIAVVTYTDAAADVVANPSFTQTGNKLQISCATVGAKIYYTDNGAEPTTSSTLYSGEITLDNSCTIRAKAFNGAESQYSSEIVKKECYVSHPTALAVLGYNGGTVDGDVWSSSDFTLTNNVEGRGIGYVNLAGSQDGFKLNHTDSYTLKPSDDIKVTKIVVVGKSWLQGDAGNASTIAFDDFAPASGAFYDYETGGETYVKTLEFTPSTEQTYGQTITMRPGNNQLGAYIEVYGTKRNSPDAPQPVLADAVTWDFSSSAAQDAAGTVTEEQTNTLTATDGSSTITYVAGGDDTFETSKGYYLKPGGKSAISSSKLTNRYFLLNISTSGVLSVTSNSSKIGEYLIYQGTTNDPSAATQQASITTTSGSLTMTGNINIDNGSYLFVGFGSQIYTESLSWTPASEDITLTTSANMAGWRAFYDASKNYSVDSNTKVYVADSDPVGETITLNAIEGVPANVPVILHTSSSDESYKMTLTKVADNTYSYTGNNLLKVTDGSAVAGAYRLGFGSKVGFYPYSATNPASGIVYLNVNTSARALSIVFDEGETTGIDAMHNSQCIMHNEYFDLQGRRIAQPTKGLYIVNGKKVVIK